MHAGCQTKTFLVFQTQGEHFPYGSGSENRSLSFLYGPTYEKPDAFRRRVLCEWMSSYGFT